MRKIRTLFVAALATGLAATAFNNQSAQAADEYVIGLAGALTGPTGSTYKPIAEATRVYFENVNAKGGINGHKVKLIIRDSANDPLRVVADLKAFGDNDEVNAVVFASPATAVGAYTQVSEKLGMPTIYVNACYPPATPPEPNKEFFCPGISTLVDSLTLVDLMFELMKGKKIVLAFVTTNVPGARIAAQKIMAPYAEKKGAKVIDVAVMPIPTTDLVPVVRGFKDKGVNAMISYTFSHHMLAAGDAVDKLNYDVTYLLGGHLPGVLSQVAQIKNPNVYAMDHFSLLSEGKPVHSEIMAATKKYGYEFPMSDIRIGWRAAIVTEEALKACGWPCSREKLVGVLNKLNVDRKDMVDLNGVPVTFSETNHTSPRKAYRVYGWDEKAGNLKTVVDWFVNEEKDWVRKKKK